MATINVPSRTVVLVEATFANVVNDYARLESFTIAQCSSDEYVKVLKPKTYIIDEYIYSNGVKSKWVKGAILSLTIEHRIKDVTEFEKDGEIVKHTITHDSVVTVESLSLLHWLSIEESLDLPKRFKDSVLKSIEDSINRANRLAAFE